MRPPTLTIALPSCRTLPEHEVDDAPLHAALEARGARVERPCWDDSEVDWRSYDAALIRTTWDYQDRRDAFVEWARECGRQTRLFNPSQVVEWNTHKSYLHDLQRLGARLAPTAWLWRGAQVDVAELCRTHRWERAFLKPMVGATARETLRFDCDPQGFEAARAHVERLLPHEDLLLQSYVESVETEGELSAVFVGDECTHGVRKVPVPGDYRVQDDFGASDEPYEFDAAELELTRAILGRIGAACGSDTGESLLYARVDYLRDRDGGLLLNEVELVEPSLFFRHAPAAAERLAKALLDRCRSSENPPRE